jgi:hypothetical protein
MAMLVLLVCDVIGGFVALAFGANGWNEAWGFETDSTVPLPVGVVQLVLAWLAARNVRPPVGLVAATLLSTFCMASLLFGAFDGDLIGNIETTGLLSWQVAWGFVLLLMTGVVGVLALVRTRQLYRLR